MGPSRYISCRECQVSRQARFSIHQQCQVVKGETSVRIPPRWHLCARDRYVPTPPSPTSQAIPSPSPSRLKGSSYGSIGNGPKLAV